MTRAAARGLAALLGAAIAVGAGAEEQIDPLRLQAAQSPREALVAGRRQLDSGLLSGSPGRERELLWWLGGAALQIGDDSALAEFTLRLDSLGEQDHDPLALAYAGFLRGERLLEQGRHEAGLAESLRAAERLQGSEDSRQRAIAAMELCDAYTMAGQAKVAESHCNRSTPLWRGFAEPYELARALNIEAAMRYYLGERERAAELFSEARQHFIDAGAPGLGSIVADNLARVLVDLDRAEQALQLSQQSLQQDLRDGRSGHALLTRGNIARARLALGQLDGAREQIDLAIEGARAQAQPASLVELLQLRADITAALGDREAEIASLRELIALQAETAPADQGALLAELEARYQARERELRIGELERQAEQHQARLQLVDAELRAQQATSLAVGLAAVALALVALLLGLLWRNQRRHARALHEQTLRDPLTGVENRRGLFNRIGALLRLPLPAEGRAHALLIIDLDHFKQVNDQGGHPLGDAVLIDVAACLRDTLVERGHLGRLGGEEFGIVLPAVSLTDGLRLAEELRAAVAQLSFRMQGHPLPITVSIGFAVLDGVRCHDLGSWMRAADQALYQAKAHGRNRVVASASVS